MKIASRLFCLLLSCAFFIFPLVSLAQPQAQTERKTILDFKEQVGLSGEQEEKIRKIIQDFETKSAQISEKVENQRKKVLSLLKEEADIKDIQKEIKTLFSLRADLVIEEIKAGREIDKLLTPEQLKKWREIKIKGGKF